MNQDYQKNNKNQKNPNFCEKNVFRSVSVGRRPGFFERSENFSVLTAVGSCPDFTAEGGIGSEATVAVPVFSAKGGGFFHLEAKRPEGPCERSEFSPISLSDDERFNSSWTKDRYFSVLGLSKLNARRTSTGLPSDISFSYVDAMERRMLGAFSSAYLKDSKKKYRKEMRFVPLKPFYAVESCGKFHNPRVVKLCSCNDFVRCGVCRLKRQKRNKKKISDYLHAVEAERKKKKNLKYQNYKMITLTQKWVKGFGIGEMLDLIQRNFRKLRNRKCWSKHVTSNYFVGTYEISEDMTNIHIHVICLSRFWNVFDLSDVWRSITGDSFVVDVRPITSFQEAVKEVAKYIVKDTNPVLVDSMADYRDSHKKRRYLVTGRRPPLLDTIAISEHPVCQHCSGKIGFYGEFKGEAEAIAWLDAQMATTKGEYI